MLSHEEVEKHAKKAKIKSFINKYNWRGMLFSPQKDKWKKIEKNNITIALNVLYAKIEKAYPAYASKNNSNCEKQVSFLIIPNSKKWHYLAVKKLSLLLRGNIMVIFIVWIIFILSQQKKSWVA